MKPSKCVPMRVPVLAAMLLSASVLAAPPEPVATAVDSGWILSKLARPAPMRTSFVELRGSALLKAPLRIEGEYLRPRNDTLVREVRSPYAETTTIVTGKAGAGEVTIARGTKSRSFSLSRAPELAGLQASFGALLDGDRRLLEQHYRVATQGTRQQWTMVLVPRDKSLAAKVRDITLRGRGAELRCIETQSVATKKAPAELQRTLLAGAARAATGLAADQLAGLCHSR